MPSKYTHYNLCIIFISLFFTQPFCHSLSLGKLQAGPGTNGLKPLKFKNIQIISLVNSCEGFLLSSRMYILRNKSQLHSLPSLKNHHANNTETLESASDEHKL